MAIAAVLDQPQFGGYEYEFIEKVPEKYTCSTICTKVLRDPHLTACCGQHFCETCLQYWFRKQGREVCPHCREENFNHFLDKPVKREIDGFKIHCSNRKTGCSWVGALSSVKPHLESEKGCGYVEVSCSKNCNKQLKRKDLTKHLTQHCPLRKYKCRYCGKEDTYQTITEKHYDKCPNYPLDCPNKCGVGGIKRAEMNQHQSQCPLEPVNCPFQETGCQATLLRKDLDGHVAASNQQHLLLVMKAFQTLKEETKAELHEAKAELHFSIREEKAELQLVKQGISTVVGHLLQSCSPPQVGPLQSILSLVSHRLRKVGDQIIFSKPSADQYLHNGKTWQSPPFYYMEGYKMRLDVSMDNEPHIELEMTLAGDDIRSIRVVEFSFSLCLLKGEFDDDLPWPITHNNTVKIATQLEYYIPKIFETITTGTCISPTPTLTPVQKECETVQLGHTSGDVIEELKSNVNLVLQLY